MAPEILRSEIATFSKQLVARLAPGEVEFFDQIEASFKGRSSYTPTPVEDDPMQFGLHDATSLITPAAIAATSAVFLYLRSIFSEVAKNVGTKVLTEQVSRLLRPDANGLLIRPEQLREVHRLARLEALKYGVKDPIADAMADEIVRSLHI